MAKIRHCAECIDNRQWESVVDEDGPRPKSTMRQIRRDHSTHGTRAWGNRPWAPNAPIRLDLLMFRRNGSYVGTVISHGGKP
jgi:hypothetical protein